MTSRRKNLSVSFFFRSSRCAAATFVSLSLFLSLFSSPFFKLTNTPLPLLSRILPSPTNTHKQKHKTKHQEDKVAKAVHNYEAVVKEIDVRLSVAGGDAGKGARAQRAEVTIFTHRYGVVRVEDCEGSAYAAIDLVCDKVRAKLRRVKEKAIAQGRWPGSARPRGAERGANAAAAEAAADATFSDSDAESDSEQLASVAPEDLIREKSFALTPMSAAEAAEQLDLLGHDFYVFADNSAGGGGGVRVVYKRKEKGYGVIVPRLPR